MWTIFAIVLLLVVGGWLDAQLNWSQVNPKSVKEERR